MNGPTLEWVNLLGGFSDFCNRGLSWHERFRDWKIQENCFAIKHTATILLLHVPYGFCSGIFERLKLRIYTSSFQAQKRNFRKIHWGVLVYCKRKSQLCDLVWAMCIVLYPIMSLKKKLGWVLLLSNGKVWYSASVKGVTKICVAFRNEPYDIHALTFSNSSGSTRAVAGDTVSFPNMLTESLLRVWHEIVGATLTAGVVNTICPNS